MSIRVPAHLRSSPTYGRLGLILASANLPEIPQLVYKDVLASPVAALLVADYRGGGVKELLVVGRDGEVRGYVPTLKAEAGEREGGDGALLEVGQTQYDRPSLATEPKGTQGN